MAWSESWAARTPLRKPSFRLRLAVVNGLATAAVLLVTSVVIWHHSASAPSNPMTAIAPQPSDSAAQIAQDNQLLKEVNAAISPDEESPIEQYKISETRHPQVKASHK